MRLHDHGRAGGDGRRDVAAEHREGEGEVARAEDGDGADGDEHAADVGARAERGVAGVVDGGLDERALADGLGEQTELEGAAAGLAREAGDAEAGLGVGGGDEFVARLEHGGGHRVEELCAELAAAALQLVRRALGPSGDGVDALGGRRLEVGGSANTRARICGGQHFGVLRWG